MPAFYRLIICVLLLFTLVGCVSSEGSFAVLVGTRRRVGMDKIYADADIFARQEHYVKRGAFEHAETKEVSYVRDGILLFVRHYPDSDRVSFELIANYDVYHQAVINHFCRDYFRVYSSKYGAENICRSTP